MMKDCNKKQSGFTLVELVVVVAILGALAVVAIPKIIGTTNDARKASAKKVAMALTNASMQNYLIKGADNTKGTTVGTCTAVPTLLHLAALPSGYAVTSGSIVTPLDTATTCYLSTDTTPVVTVEFSAMGID
jgi:prepilin-type N-terminal cleavage/methylation domain-containing protein